MTDTKKTRSGLQSFAQWNRGNTLIAIAIVLCASALYLPFMGSELVFDDKSFFYSGKVFSYYATRPFDLGPRTFPYFTFAFIQALTQSFEVQRVANLIIHIGNAWLLYRAARQLVLVTESKDYTTKRLDRDLNDKELLICGFIALAFVLHPVAVYGTAYLVQRTILFATFFSLLSLLYFVRSLATDRWQPMVLAAVFTSAAMFSKEHAVTLPLAVSAVLATVNTGQARAAYVKTGTFLLLCAPAIMLVLYASKNTVANAYEIHAPIYLAAGDDAGMLWLRSILSECSSFFGYLKLWLIPNLSLMSIDLRRPFPATWHELGAISAGISFVATALLGAWLLTRSRRYKLAGFSLIYALVLFAVELTTVRVQEPFVLYRSYLWAPGFLLFGAALLQEVPQRIVLALFVFALPVLAFLAVDRLESLANNRNAWEDAAQKLTTENLPGAFRIYYNRGIHYMTANRYDLALADMERCQRLRPDFPGCHIGKAGLLERRREFLPALSAIETALALDVKNPAAWERKGRLLDARGDKLGAAEAYAEADRLGGSIGTLFRKKTPAPISTSTIR